MFYSSNSSGGRRKCSVPFEDELVEVVAQALPVGDVLCADLSKGRQVRVEGTRLKASAWLDEDGNARAALELTADNVIFLDGPRDEEEDVAEEVVQPQRKVHELGLAPATGRASRPAAQTQAKQAVRQAASGRQRSRGSVALQQDDWEEIPC